MGGIECNGQEIFSHGLDLLTKNSEGKTLAELIVHAKRNDLMALAKEYLPDFRFPKAPDGMDEEIPYKHRNPLQRWAAGSWIKDGIESALSSGTQINSQDDDGNTPLYLALEGCSGVDRALKLIEHGADPTIRNNRGDPPLKVAILNSARDPLDYFTIVGALGVSVRDENGKTPLHWAIRSENIPAISAVIGKANLWFEKDMDGETPLNELVKKDKNWLFDFVFPFYRWNLHLEHDLKNKHNQNPLHLAAKNGNVYMLIQLFHEMHSGTDDMDVRKRLPLHEAAASNSPEAVEFLLQNTKDINLQDEDGNTPLHIAASNRNYHVLNVLLKGNPLLEFRNLAGLTPREIAEQEGNLDNAEALSKAEKTASQKKPSR